MTDSVSEFPRRHEFHVKPWKGVSPNFETGKLGFVLVILSYWYNFNMRLPILPWVRWVGPAT